MTDYCAFSKDHKCIKWTDYELLRHELEEADELCHNNWTEIQHLWEYIGQLQALLIKNGIEIPPELFFARPFCIKLQKLFVGRCSCIL